MTSPEQQFETLARGAEEILPEGGLLERLRLCAREGRPLRVKQGFDPTAPDIHLGHAVGLRKLRQFQDLGHQVVLIVGDTTGMVGDPSGLTKTRPQLTSEQVEANARTYLEQFHRVLDPDPAPPRRPVEIHRNSDWLSKMQFMDVIHLASRYTLARILERDDFAKRQAAQQPIGLHELLYPLMQGYDSIAVRADVEMGGTDQKFNLLVGRALQEHYGQLPQVILTVPLLPGLDGVQRMSKSLGNYIGVTDPPHEMFGKVMSIPDSVMPIYWRLGAEATDAELEAVDRELADSGVNPMTVKKRLGLRIVTLCHGKEAAEQARRDFETQFSRREAPDSLPTWTPAVKGEVGIKDLLVLSGLAASGSAAWRAVEQGAVSIDGVRITDRGYRHNLAGPFVLRLGRKMIRVEMPSGS
ncbi:MAG: tyrosine--tRNA ligase [Candidatus Eisenbacteria bacterium]|uniref:Tyrosine--tRNA ligase n=1 Tax=Eiseniibacteriota bacterium TaxID=2212470 RepID=A0A538SE69_UNCEI|nr:MAG: tyrosine--tRNA ligase [Candidatus Eisenbacteria bacterium]